MYRLVCKGRCFVYFRRGFILRNLFALEDTFLRNAKNGNGKEYVRNLLKRVIPEDDDNYTIVFTI